MPSSPLARAAARQEEHQRTEARIQADRKAAKAGPKVVQKPKASPDMLHRQGTVFNHLVLVCPDDDFEAALHDPQYLANVVRQLHRLDHVAVINESGTREADCVVLGLNEFGGQAQLHVRAEYDYAKSSIAQADLDALFEIRDLGFAKGFGIFRKSDGIKMAVSGEMKTFDQALQRRRELHGQKLS